jgi:hypothetical protein
LQGYSLLYFSEIAGIAEGIIPVLPLVLLLGSEIGSGLGLLVVTSISPL